MAATRMAKALKKAGEGVAERLSPAEIEALTIVFPHKGRLRLGTQTQIRWEMRRVYQAAIEGRLPLTACTKLFYMLEKISRSETDEQKLWILERGGIAGAPFVGLIIEGPASGKDATNVTSERGC